MLRLQPRLAWWTFALLVAILAWDASGLDLPLAHLSGDAHGFPLKSDALFSHVLHDGARYLSWMLVLVLCVAVVQPFGPFRALSFSRRLQWPVSALLAAGAVALLKSFSATSCPWDLAEFGGVAQYLSHWSGWLRPDGGGGRCFPAGHASSGFALLGGYFAFREARPWLARVWLGLAVALGLFLGVVQQLRGAHFMSHTLWTGWVCWVTVWWADIFFTRQDLMAPASDWAS